MDVNDNAPMFSQHEYKINIVESIPLSPPAPILQLRAEDKDSTGQLEYSIVSGNTEGNEQVFRIFCLNFMIYFYYNIFNIFKYIFVDVFMLDSITGIMYPRISLKNQLPYYTLLVQVTDGVHVDEARIDINVQAINQNQPVFTFPTSSNSTVFIKEVRFYLKINM